MSDVHSGVGVGLLEGRSLLTQRSPVATHTHTPAAHSWHTCINMLLPHDAPQVVEVCVCTCTRTRMSDFVLIARQPNAFRGLWAGN